MREEILCAGFGGQGIMTLGKILAQAAMNEKRFVSWMPSYGAEVRGGTAHSMVVISDSPIGSPLVTHPDTCIVMNEPSLDKFEKHIKKGGLLIFNTSLINRRPRRRDIRVLGIPLTDIANSCGSIKAANIVALGAYIGKKKTMSVKNIRQALSAIFKSFKSQISKTNNLAFEEGIKFVSKKKG